VLEAANDNIPAHGSLYTLDANNKKKGKKSHYQDSGLVGCLVIGLAAMATLVRGLTK